MSQHQRHAVKRALVIVHDLVVTAVCWILAFMLRYDFDVPDTVWSLLGWSTPVAVGVLELRTAGPRCTAVSGAMRLSLTSCVF